MNFPVLLCVIAALAICLDVVVALAGITSPIDKWTFGFALLSLLALVVRLSHSAISRFLSVPADPRTLPWFRVIYAALCLITALQHLTLIPSGLEPLNFAIIGLPKEPVLTWVCAVLYIGSLLCVLFGVWLRPAWILVFLTGGLMMPFSLEVFLKNIVNFFAIFISPALWRGHAVDSRSSGWPLMLMWLSFAVITTCAGVFKLLDPVWQQGLGFYYSLNIPFFVPRHLWALLDWPWFMWGGNWITIAVETASLPLFICRKTRPIGLLALVGLGLFLAYPMAGIGLVGGPVVLAVAIGLLAVCPSALRLFATGLRLRSTKVHSPANARRHKPADDLPWIAVPLFWWCIIGFSEQLFVKEFGVFSTPPAYGEFHNSQTPERSGPLTPMERRFYAVQRLLSRARPPVLWETSWVLPLFDYHHLFDRVVFRVVIKDSSGEWSEPVTFFAENGAKDPSCPLPANERWLLTAWRIMEVAQTGNKENIHLHQLSEFKSLMRYSAESLPKTSQPVEGRLEVRPLHQPYRYEGNSKPWTNGPFTLFMRYDFDSDTAEMISLPQRYDFAKLEIPAFRDRVLVPKSDSNLFER